MRDLIVAGGGPVGLVAALHARRAGLDVEVREPRHGALDKACGEGLMPSAVAALAELGVHPQGHPLTGIRYVQGGRQVSAAFRRGPGLGVRRTTLHDSLTTAAKEAGVVVERRRVDHVEMNDRQVWVDGDPAGYLIAADGLHSPLRRRLGLAGTPRGPRRHGLRSHVSMAPWTSYVEVHWAPEGEAYVTPVADDQVGIAVLTDRRCGFVDALAWFPLLAARVAGHSRGRVLGAGPLHQPVRQPSVGRVLLVGDAAGYVDALTGEGLAVGFEQAATAVACVGADDPAGYPRRSRAIGRRRKLLTQGLLLATRPQPVRRSLVPAAAILPGTFDRVVQQLA